MALTSSSLCFTCTVDVSNLPAKAFDREPDHFSYFSSSDLSCSIQGAFKVSVSESKDVILLSFMSRMFDLSFVCCDDNGRIWLDDEIRELSNGRDRGLL